MKLNLPPAAPFNPPMLQNAFDQLRRWSTKIEADNIVDGSITNAELAGGSPQIANYSAASSGDLTLTTTVTDVTGATRTLVDIGSYFIIGTFDFDHTVVGGGVAIGALDVAGTPLAASALLSESGLIRATVSQLWFVTTASANSVAKLRASKTIAAGTVIARATHTTIIAFRVN